MADQLATPQDLASLLERDDIDLYKATMLVEIATSLIQEAAGGQRIVEVDNDVLAVGGTTDSWLQLPQLPVISVDSVVLDGVTLDPTVDDYKLVGSRMFRRLGWQTNIGWPMGWQFPVWGIDGTPWNWSNLLSEPSLAAITYSHGYPAGSQELQLARSFVLAICAGAYGNPTGLRAESIDDYTVTYDVLAGQLSASPYMKAAIAKKYGRRAGFVRIG